MVIKRMFVAALLIAVFCISPLTAQISRFTSNTNMATGGLFQNGTDNFLDVNNWQNVEFDTFFSTVQVDNIEGLGAGFSLRAGSVYLGFGYFGTLWQGAMSSVTREYGNTFAITDRQGRETVGRSANLTWTNQLSVLVGTEFLGGFLLDFNLAGFGRNNNDQQEFDNGNVVTNEEAIRFGAIEFGLTWGRNFALGDLYLKPTLGFSYNTNIQSIKDRPAGGERTTTLTSVDPFFSRTDLGFTGLQGGQVGLTGGFNIHAGLGVDRAFGDVDGSFWASYDLEIRRYYRQQRTDSGSRWTDFSPAFTGHVINIGVGAWYRLDRRLSFAWAAESDIGIISAAIFSAQDESGLPPDHAFSTTIFEIIPTFTAGIVFAAVPDRLNINASLAFSPLQYTFIQQEHNDLFAATVTEWTSNNIGNARTLTSLGFTWIIGDNFSLDAALNATANARIDVTEFSILLSYRR